VKKFTIELYELAEFALPVVHSSAARWPKRKTFPPKFLENRKSCCQFFGTVWQCSSSGQNSWNMPLIFRFGG